MNTPIDFAAMTRWLRACRRPLLLSHQRPDGDALGAMAGLARLLRAWDQEPTAALYDPLPARYRFMEPLEAWVYWRAGEPSRLDAHDAVVIVDTCAAAQLEPVIAHVAGGPRVLVVDHHVTRDALADRAADLCCIDETAGATCLLLTEWALATGLRIDAAVATPLFIGLATDTGWFKYSNADARALAAASVLVGAGANPCALYDQLYQQEPAPKLHLIGRMLAGMDLLAGGRLAVLSLRIGDFQAVGADQSMTEDLVNEVHRLAGHDATILFTEQPDGRIRVNFRSKQLLDCAALAQRFGGGGHVRAAGARASGNWSDATRTIVNAAVEMLKAAEQQH
ncbi:MAG: bifunctional oligoribonuclease/PAP phosphatase NrnA [Phycisphaerae bacterium]